MSMRTRNLLIVLGCWLIVAAVFTAQQIVTAAAPQDATGIAAIAIRTLLFDLLWAAMTFAIVAVVRRAPPAHGGYARFIALHAGLSIVAAATQLYTYTSILSLFRDEPVPFSRLAAANLSTGLFIYWLVLGVVVAVDQRRRSEDRQRAQHALERSLADTRAAMLRAQLQPHFLFNTLNTISALIGDEPRTAERMVARLGDLLRISLDDTRGVTVTLAEDLAALDAYLAIEALRLGDRLTIVRHLAADTMASRVPDLLLQPLVENAIRHGLAPKVNGGTVTLVTRREGDSLRIEVSDDGVGTAAAPIREGIGLRNTRERIALVAGQGQGAGLTVRSAAGDGFSVEITLPWKVA